MVNCVIGVPCLVESILLWRLEQSAVTISTEHFVEDRESYFEVLSFRTQSLLFFKGYKHVI